MDALAASFIWFDPVRSRSAHAGLLAAWARAVQMVRVRIMLDARKADHAVIIETL